jgi:hypothetical protein
VDWGLKTDAEIRSDPDIQACSKVVNLFSHNSRGSPFRCELVDSSTKGGLPPRFRNQKPDEKTGI